MKKITAIVGSPHSKNSFSGQLVSDFLKLVEARVGAVTSEILVLGTFEIGPCRGCFGCSESGNCVIADDLAAIQKKLTSADMIVVASPVYANHVTALMKAFFERSFMRAHALSLLGKPAITAVTAAYSDMSPVEAYLDWALCAFGAIPVGHLRQYEYRQSPPLSNQPEVSELIERVAALLDGREVPRPTDGNRRHFEQLKRVLPNMPAGYAKKRWSSHGWYDTTFDAAIAAARQT